MIKDLGGGEKTLITPPLSNMKIPFCVWLTLSPSFVGERFPEQILEKRMIPY